MSLTTNQNSFEIARAAYQSPLPLILQEFSNLNVHECLHDHTELDQEIQRLFPATAQQPCLTFENNKKIETRQLTVGVYFSGGQAPGGNTVIAGLWDALKKLNNSSRLVGFIDGPNGLLDNQTLEITDKIIADYRNQGGFDLLGSSRTKIHTFAQFLAVENTVDALALDGLVIIGGDDSNTNAALLAEYFKNKHHPISIIGIPKTIDGDLTNAYIEASFGYDTACKTYAEMIGNLAKDALSAKKYYFFVKMMGRAASHVTLECALITHINLALISEEIAEEKMTLQQVIAQIADLICMRMKANKNYGVILIPEGIIEYIEDFKEMIQEINTALHSAQAQSFKTSIDRNFIENKLSSDAQKCFMHLPEEFQQQLLLERDEHGNIQVSKIETERLFIQLVKKELNTRKSQNLYSGQFNPQPLFCGYEGRSAFPSNFDCHYCYALGHVATALINSKKTGYMACVNNLAAPVSEWQVRGIPLVKMMHFEIRKGKKKVVIKKSLVDVKSKLFSYFKQNRSDWSTQDCYCSPGPIQYFGSEVNVNLPPFSLMFLSLNPPSTSFKTTNKI